MRHMLACVLLLLGSPAAHADKPTTITLAPAKAEDNAPTPAANEKRCEDAGGGVLQAGRIKTKRAEAVAMLECGAIPAGAELYIHTGDGWFSTFAGTIRDMSTMSEQRSKTSLAHAAFTTGSLGHGKSGALLQLDVTNEALHPEDTTPTTHRSELTVCSLENVPRCGRITVACKGACETAVLTSKGVRLAGKLYPVK